MAKGRELLIRLEPYQQQDLLKLKELYRKAVELEVESLSDPDARWGFKKKDEPFLGYKAHVACDETGLSLRWRSPRATRLNFPRPKYLLANLKSRV